MKRFVTCMVILCLAFTLSLAEEEQPKSVLDSIGGWFGQKWEAASGWVSQAWSDVSKWVEGAWGDASKWVEQAWNDSSDWITDIWGDVSTWATETYESASGSIGAWWAKTFNTVTESTRNPWGWLSEELAILPSDISESLPKVKGALIATGSDAESQVKEVFYDLVRQLNLADEEVQKVWDTIQSYAEQKGISQLTASKLALPYLLQLRIDSSESKDAIPAIAIAQYLTAIIEKLNINNNEIADGLVEQLNEVLDRN